MKNIESLLHFIGRKIINTSISLKVLHSLNQTPWLLFISSHNFVRLLFKSGYYSSVAFIKLGMHDKEIHCLKEGGVAADARESIRRDTTTLATAMDTKFNPFTDV